MVTKKNIFRILLSLLLFILAITLPIYSQETESSEQAATEEGKEKPTTDTIIPRHWSKYQYPEVIEKGKKVHIIEKGDTLWDLAKKYLNDNYLWPKLWEANPYIKKSHWIYPGDPIVIPTELIPVSAEAIQKAEAEATKGEIKPETVIDLSTGKPVEEEPGVGFLEEEFIGDISQIRPIAKYYDLYCYDSVLPDENMFDARIIAIERRASLNLKTDDYAFIDIGEMHNVKVGDTYTVLNVVEKVYHPVDDSFMGYVYRRTGKLKVVMTFMDFSIARISEVCTYIQVGDQIKPDVKMAIPVLLEELVPVDYYVESTEKPKGYIIHGQNSVNALGKGYLCVIDLGREDGLQAGDQLVIYSENPVRGLPRTILGKAIALVAEDKTSVIKIMQNRDYIMIGDMVEIQ